MIALLICEHNYKISDPTYECYLCFKIPYKQHKYNIEIMMCMYVVRFVLVCLFIPDLF